MELVCPDFSKLVEETRDEIVELFRDLLRADTTNTGKMPTGNETRAVVPLKRKFDEEGIEYEVFSRAEERGNILARLPGEKIGPRLLYLSHLDVVPVEDEAKWEYSPFGAQIVENKIYGRGASDCKDLVAAEAMAFVILKRANVKPNHEILFLASADEEVQAEYGLRWLLGNHRDKVLTEFAINEGGGVPLEYKGRLLYPLCTGEKGAFSVEIETFGKSFHSSKPWLGDNALYHMWRVLERIEKYKSPIDVSQPIFSELDNLLGVEERPSSANIDKLIETVDGKDENLADDLIALSRMTLSPTIIHGGIKSNVVPSYCNLKCSLRTLPDQDEAFVTNEMSKLLEGLSNVRFKVCHPYSASTSSPFETPLKGAIVTSMRRALNDDATVIFPTLMPASSDSRLLRPLGTIVYGFSPLHPAVDKTTCDVHCPNECTDIRSLLLKTMMLVFLMTTFSS